MRISGLFALFCIAAVPLATFQIPVLRAQTTTAAAPRTAAAALSTTEASARDALRELFGAILAGDEKKAFGLIAYAKPENRKLCEDVLSEAAAGRRLTAVVAERFGKEAADQLDLNLDDLVVIEKGLEKAKVTVKGDAAEVIADPKMPAYVMVRKEGKWLLDFEKSQENMGPTPDGQASARHAAGYDQIAAAIKARKLTSIQDVKERVRGVQMVTTVAPAADGAMPALPR